MKAATRGSRFESTRLDELQRPRGWTEAETPARPWGQECCCQLNGVVAGAARRPPTEAVAPLLTTSARLSQAGADYEEGLPQRTGHPLAPAVPASTRRLLPASPPTTSARHRSERSARARHRARWARERPLGAIRAEPAEALPWPHRRLPVMLQVEPVSMPNARMHPSRLPLLQRSYFPHPVRTLFACATPTMQCPPDRRVASVRTCRDQRRCLGDAAVDFLLSALFPWLVHWRRCPCCPNLDALPLLLQKKKSCRRDR